MTTRTEPVGPIGRPTDAALWAGFARTLREVVLPAVTDEFARLTVVHLVGLAHYAMVRGEDQTAAHTQALADVLNQLRGLSVVDACWPVGADASTGAVMEATSAVLAACASLSADDHQAVTVRTVLRPVVIAQLDADLVGNAVLLDAFRGRLPDA
jgi:hypothetical protein